MDGKRGTLAINVYYEPSAIAQKVLPAFGTGWVQFVHSERIVTRNYSQRCDYSIPNIPDTQTSMRLIWSSRWMESNVAYTGRNGETLFYPQFTFKMDEEVHEFQTYNMYGLLLVQYSGRWEPQ